MSGGALAGLRVIDCTRVLGGPFCTQWLGDHGAEVIKIEPPTGDETRGWGPPFEEGSAAYFRGVNRSKKGITLDLSSEEGQDALLRLLETADIMVENFKTGTLEKWGIGHDVLSAKFPQLIHCRISGFGADGPYGGLPGYDAIVQAQAGLMSVNGTPESGPLRLGIPIVDIATGISAAFGIMSAGYERTKSGKGQFVEASLYDVACSLLHPHAANYFMGGKEPSLTGNAHPNIVPYDMFEAGNKQVFIGTGNDRQFQRLCKTIGAAELAEDPRFATNATRKENTDALRTLLEEQLKQFRAEDICEKLMAAGVPAGPVNGIAAVFDNEHTRHREMLVEFDNYRGTGNPVKFSRTPAQINRKPPKFGEHNDEVLGVFSKKSETSSV